MNKPTPVLVKDQGVEMPTIGHIVHYVLDNPQFITMRKDAIGEHRPALVVRVWPGYDGINLQIFLDGSNDCPNLANEYMTWRTSVPHDEETKAPGTWHWPERNM